MIEEIEIVLGENSLEFIVDHVLDVLGTVGISLRAGSWRIRFIVVYFTVEEDLKFGESLSCFWSTSPSFAGN